MKELRLSKLSNLPVLLLVVFEERLVSFDPGTTVVVPLLVVALGELLF